MSTNTKYPKDNGNLNATCTIKIDDAQETHGSSDYTRDTEGLDATCTIQIGDLKEQHDSSSTERTTSTGDSTFTSGVFGSVLDYIQHRVLKHSKGKSIDTANSALIDDEKEINVEKDVVNESDFDELSTHYDIKKAFAEGGQGILSSANDKILNRIVVLKSLRKEHLNNDKIRRAFINEALITAQLEHPSIVAAYGLLKDDSNGIHLTMQLIRGRTLKAILDDEISAFEQGKRSRWNYIETLRFHMDIFLKICEAIGYAHSRNIIHCDLKPENIMVGNFGATYVMDWGIAKNITAEKEAFANGTHTLDGTPRFMPHEAFEKQPRTKLTDIYSLGMILYEIVCLQRGYDEKDLKTLVRKIRMDERKPIKNRFGVPIAKGLAAIIDKATAYEPEDRYQDTYELASDLRAFLTNSPIKALPENFWMKSKRFLSQHIQLVITLALLGWLFALSMSLFSMKHKRDDAIMQRDIVTGQMNEQIIINDTLKYHEHLLNMNGNVIQASMALSNKMLEVANNLKHVVDYTGILNDMAGQFAGNRHRQLQILDYHDYQNDASETHGKIASATYYGKAINPDVLSFVMPPNADQAAYMRHLTRMQPISHELYALVLSSNGQKLESPQMEEKLKEQMLSHGLLIRRAYIGMDSTGLQIAYPFNPEYSSDYDNRKREWYIVTKKAFETHGSTNAVWGAPYKDSGKNGRLLLACTLPILDDKNNFIGVAGADIHFEYLVNLIGRNGNAPEGGVTEKFLLNSEGQTLCHLNSDMLKDLAKDTSEVNMDAILDSSYELPRMLHQKILQRKSDYGFLEAFDEKGRYCIFFYSYLPNSDLCIVEKAEQELVLKALNIKNIKRKSLRH